MKNSVRNIRYEVIVVILLLLIVTATLLKCILGAINSQKFKTMRSSAMNMKNAVMSNGGDFHNVKKIYLNELIDKELMTDIKSPVSKGICSKSESFAELVDGTYKITLKCGNYLLEDASFIADDNGIFYKVSDWSKEKSENDNDEDILYNCLVGDKEKYNEYYEKEYLLYLINKNNNKEYNSIEEIDSNMCKIATKTFYRGKDISDN